MANVRVLATGLEFPEGPVVMPDGSVVLVEIRGQRLTRVWPDGRKEVVAQIPGGPNGAALGPDGKMLHLQQWRLLLDSDRAAPSCREPQPEDYLGGSIQRVDLQSGKVETVVDQMRRACACAGRTTWCSTGMAGCGSPISASAAPATWMSARSTTSSPA